MIDVYLLSGFLGSGKTSALLHLVKQLKEQYKKPAVFMNEFGALPIDSNTVKEDVPLKEVLDGCICCSGAEKTEAQLQSLLVENPDVDVIIIETTGAAHPVEALDAVYSPLFANDLQVKGIITIVDSMLWLNRSTLSPRIHALFTEQIKHAHLLLANKSDLLSEEQLANVTYELSQFNENAMVIQTTNGKVGLNLVEKVLNRPKTQSEEQIIHARHLPLDTKLMTFTKPVDIEAFEEWVKSLPSTVYRMKGFVPVKGTEIPYLFQYAYGMVHWMPEQIKMDPKIVIIGENIVDLQFES